MTTKEQALANLETAKAKAIELLKRDPKKSALAIGATLAAVAVLSAEDGGGFGFGGSKTHEINDLNGPGGQMVAGTIETPSGWSVQGGVNWHNPSDPTDPYKVNITAQSMGRLDRNFREGQLRNAERSRNMDIANQNWWDGQRSDDAAHRNWMNGHLGQSDFNNPHTGMIETHSDTGGRMWQDGSGNTFETETWQDDPRMHPDNWGTGLEEMQRIQW